MAGAASTGTTGKGLEGITVAESRQSKVNGAEGRLTYHGYDITELAEPASFEEVVFLFYHDRLPTQSELSEIEGQLRAARTLAPALEEAIRALPTDVHPMAALRTAVSLAGMHDPDAETNNEQANRNKAIRLVGSMPTMVATWARARKGLAAVAPDPELSHAANFLWMLNGERPDPFVARTMNVALILHADHGFNASTFSSRVTAATMSDIYSAVTSGTGTLKGPLHGGANERVMRTLLDIEKKAEGDVRGYIFGMLDRGEKLMGFGHRVYRAMDPRATLLREMSGELAKRTGDERWYRLSTEVEQAFYDHLEMRNKERIAEGKTALKLYPNVDFFSASTYYMMGIPLDLYTPIFAISRVLGWTSHVLEQYANNRLIRPLADYTGSFGLKYTPIASRGGEGSGAA